MSSTVFECHALAMGTVRLSAPFEYPPPRGLLQVNGPRLRLSRPYGANFCTHWAQAQHGPCVSAGQRLAKSPSESVARNTLRGYMREALAGVSAGQGLSGTVWQVKDSNLRSFRDGFTARCSQAADLHKRLTTTNIDTLSTQTADAPRRPSGITALSNKARLTIHHRRPDGPQRARIDSSR